jgi:hypothetical protein
MASLHSSSQSPSQVIKFIHSIIYQFVEIFEFETFSVFIFNALCTYYITAITLHPNSIYTEPLSHFLSEARHLSSDYCMFSLLHFHLKKETILTALNTI